MLTSASASPKANGYGELASGGARLVLRALQPRAGDSLVDLGSGAGRFVLQAAAAHPGVRVAGVELARSRHEVAVRAATRAALRNLELIHGDMLDAAQFAHATLVYVSPILFHSDFIDRLGSMMDGLTRLRTIASLGRRFPPSALASFDERVEPIMAEVSWREEPIPVHVYDKSNDEGTPCAGGLPTVDDAARSASKGSSLERVERVLAAYFELTIGEVYEGPLLRARPPGSDPR